jgi:hypothetical protein
MRMPRYVHGFVDRHGKALLYFRRADFKTGIRDVLVVKAERQEPLVVVRLSLAVEVAKTRSECSTKGSRL